MIERIKKRGKLGFSLVELIVVIAIMAILTAILTPAFLQYVERSRAAKDNSAMCEVTNAVKIAMANPNVYDELLMVESGKEAMVPSGYANSEDEVAAAFAGEQRGVIITFKPEADNKQSVIKLADGIINGAAAGDTSVAEGDDGKLGDLTAGDGENHLIDILINICGDKITLTSQTYRNSEYTIFIKIGPSNADFSITVEGYWNGTNLPNDGSGGSGGGSGEHEHIDADGDKVCDDTSCKEAMGGNQPEVPALDLKENFADNSWSNIAAACQAAASGDATAIAAINNWNVGDILTMPIDGIEHKVMIIGKDHDVYSHTDENIAKGIAGKPAPLTFQLVNCYNTKGQMESTGTNKNGWSGSAMRTTTLQNILNVMPLEVKDAVKSVVKATIKGKGQSSNDPTALEYTNDQLFLLSEIEVLGSVRNSAGINEGTRYEFYKNGSPIKTGNAVGSASIQWWLRSPSSSYTTTFNYVDNYGYRSDSRTSENDFGISFGFCF